jgi:hypothetical protein
VSESKSKGYSMTTRPLTESFDILGDWFLPDNPERKIAGRLYYTPQSIELHLNEAFQPLFGEIQGSDKPQIYSVINGITTKGEAITLLNAYRTRITMNFGSGGLRQPEVLTTSWLFIGANFNGDITLNNVSFRVPALQFWRSLPTIDQVLEKENITDNIKSTSFNILGIEKEITPVPSIDSTIEWAISRSSTTDFYTSLSVAVFSWVIIKPSLPQPIEWFIEQYQKLSTLLAFLAGSPMSCDCIEASLPNDLRDISVLVTMRDNRICSYKNQSNFFMTRRDLGIDLNKVIDRWFAIYPKIQNPSQLALSVISSEKLWLYIMFLSLIQALEGFHRALYKGNYMEENCYEKVKAVLIESIPTKLESSLRDSLCSRLRYGNQVSLMKRLNELVQELSLPIRKTILGENGNIPRSWIDTRNYYTHWDEELKNISLDNENIYFSTIRMQNLLQVLYLNLAGIPQEVILKSLLNTSDQSQTLAHVNSIERRRIDPNDKSGLLMKITQLNDGNTEGNLNGVNGNELQSDTEN